MFYTLLYINREEINKKGINNMRTRKILRARTLQGDLIMEDINHFTEDKYHYNGHLSSENQYIFTR